ncbi:MAG: hydrogenase maturation protease [Mariprofundus sp.]|nr:hydrogenase maturation protease [Mariprofundus sp.]
MTTVNSTPAILLFGYGNPGRGDDAVGPALIEAMQTYLTDNSRSTDVECLTDMQLQIEHVTDMINRDRILFIDADMSCEEGCALRLLPSAKDDSYTTHAMSPGALIYTYQQVYNRPAPSAYVLSIRTYTFELGDDICEQARKNLALAIEMAKAFCAGNYETSKT